VLQNSYSRHQVLIWRRINVAAIQLPAWIYAIYEAKIETLISLEGFATRGIIIRWICHLQGAHPNHPPALQPGVVVAAAEACRRCLGFGASWPAATRPAERLAAWHH
jgi:hypothetical protein